ncbi:MAG: hypothetical protein CMF67_12015 [Magnetovibrio sp.]|nr:hypothetical protein [Magnetovibrio sp.]|tara:strand:+ start:17231 stop:19534 length:2304 start_codon:yes stop_codon:yes gene_type:complete
MQTLYGSEPDDNTLRLLFEKLPFGGAEQILDEIAQLQYDFPLSINLFNFKGAIWNRLGDVVKSTRCYRRAILLRPDEGQFYSSLGNVFYLTQNYSGSTKLFCRAKVNQPNNRNTHFNLGNSYREQGDLERAALCYKRSLELDNRFIDGYNSLGLILLELKEINEAELLFNTALQIDKAFSKGYNNLGLVQKHKNDHETALKNFKRAICIEPDSPNLYFNLGETHWKEDEFLIAFKCYLKEFVICDDNKELLGAIGLSLLLMRFTKPSFLVEQVIHQVLKRKTSCKPLHAVTAALSIIKNNYKNIELINPPKENEHDFQGGLKHLRRVAENQLFMELITLCSIPDKGCEDFLTFARRFITLNLEKLLDEPSVLSLSSAIALQCYVNDFMFVDMPEERTIVSKLEETILTSLAGGATPPSIFLSCLASYKPIIKYPSMRSIKFPLELECLKRRQLLEPLEQITLRETMPSHGKIVRMVSQKVQAQYEQNPYPKWVKLHLSKPMLLDEIAVVEGLKIFDKSILKVVKPEVLIAGCGTGQHSITTANSFLNSRVLAIDLSLNSLAYAKMKTRKLGINNIDYLHADILNLDKLNRQFDIIESIGVLHHMADPLEGWQILRRMLRPSGMMRIGLYSARARKSVTAVRNRFKGNYSQLGDDELRSLRAKARNSSDNHWRTVLESGDAYSLSEFRDLALHVQEHQFTISQIEDLLSDLNLKFCGFVLTDYTMRQKFKKHFPEKNTEFDLKKWDVFEKNNEYTFAGMYQFWCQSAT